jgi:twitching motility two-component system response regulator PilH
MIESILRSAGHDVLSYPTGKAGRKESPPSGPTCPCWTSSCPSGTGTRSCASSRRTNGRSTPVVIVTGRSQESDRVWSKLQGADEYVTKPFAAAPLLSVIQNLAG